MNQKREMSPKGGKLPAKNGTKIAQMMTLFENGNGYSINNLSIGHLENCHPEIVIFTKGIYPCSDEN
jgi:hypothetical protein